MENEPTQPVAAMIKEIVKNDNVAPIVEAVSEIQRRFRQCFGSMDGQRCKKMVDITDDKSKAYCCASCKNKTKSERSNPLLSTTHRIHKQVRRTSNS